MSNTEFEECRNRIIDKCEELEEPCPELTDWKSIAKYIVEKTGNDDGEAVLYMLVWCQDYPTLHNTIGIPKQIEIFELERDKDALANFKNISELNNRINKDAIIALIKKKYPTFESQIEDLIVAQIDLDDLIEIWSTNFTDDGDYQECSDCGKDPENFFEKIFTFSKGICFSCQEHLNKCYNS